MGIVIDLPLSEPTKVNKNAGRLCVGYDIPEYRFLGSDFRNFNVSEPTTLKCHWLLKNIQSYTPAGLTGPTNPRPPPSRKRGAPPVGPGAPLGGVVTSRVTGYLDAASFFADL